MLGTHDLWIFVVAGLVLNVTPGPDTFYILGRSLSQGRGAGVLSALAIGTGSLFHTSAAALGLSAILAKSALAFQLIRYTGAAYLVYLGLRMLLEQSAAVTTSGNIDKRVSLWAIYRQGVITNVLNPKVALFFLAFLPQFVDPSTSSRMLAFLFLGIVFTCNGTIWCIMLACFAARLSQRLRGSERVRAWLHRATGALFISLGAKLAVDR